MDIASANPASEIPGALVLLFPVFFVGLWCLICLLISRIGGWSRLAEKFATTEVPPGTVLEGQSVKLSGLTNYNRCLTIIIAKEGLYMKVWPIFGIGHKPILIPWNEIRNGKPGRFLWMRTVSFEAGNPKIARISLSEKVFNMFPNAAA